MTHGAVVVAVMARRELIRFIRQPARIAAAVGTPAVFWLFMAGGFAEAFGPEKLGDVGFGAYLLPGMMTLVAIFGATFASLSVIEDRNEGWLYAAIVSPAPRWSIALGRVLGGTVVSWAQAALLLALIPVLGLRPSAWEVGLALLAVGLTSLGMTAIGVAFAWRTETAGGFHAVMNLLFMPLWLLSGSIFPVQGASPWMIWLTRINPLAWCTDAIRGPLLGDAQLVPLLVAAGFAVLTLAAATRVFAAPRLTS